MYKTALINSPGCFSTAKRPMYRNVKCCRLVVMNCKAVGTASDEPSEVDCGSDDVSRSMELQTEFSMMPSLIGGYMTAIGRPKVTDDSQHVSCHMLSGDG